MKKVPGSDERTRKENPPDIPFRCPPAKVPKYGVLYVLRALPINWSFAACAFFERAFLRRNKVS